jgi:hypothetical protein
MLSLGALAFAAPYMLGLLAVLPVIWWLLRLMPPLPRLVEFPALRLLRGLVPEEQTPVKMPWWLLLLRLLLVALLIVALAKPLLNPQAELAGSGPLLLVVDDGWGSAPGWATRQQHLERLTQRAERAGRPVMLLTTAPAGGDDAPLQRGAMRADEARALIRAMRPKSWPTDRAAAAAELDRQQLAGPMHVAWLADGLDSPDAARLAGKLEALGTLEVVLPDGARMPMLLLPPSTGGRDMTFRVQRVAADGPRRVAVQASDEQGRIVARAEMDFAPTATEAQTTITAPSELRNRIARLDIEGQGSAGAASLLDERFRRRPVGILGEQPTAAGQPLLQEVYFLERALEPFVSLTVGDRATALTRQTAVLLVPDGAAPSPSDRELIVEWIEKGGVTVRFAGPRLAAGTDDLVPVRLRLGDRSIGGVMSWGQPAVLAEFSANSPFYGLRLPPDVRVSQQVLAEPAPDLAEKTWARLSDGTPLVTAERRGQGWLVLVHTTANAAWSNLAFSGLFVDMLQRMVALSRGVAGDGGARALKPWRTLDGFGRLSAPPAGVQTLPPDAQQSFRPGPQTPPGLYGDESAQVAFNIGGRIEALRPFVVPGVAIRDRLSEGGETDLTRWFLAAALSLLLFDLMLSFWLRGLLAGALRVPPRRVATAALALVAVLGGIAGLPAPDAQAQAKPADRPPPSLAVAPPERFTDEQALRATLEIRLAYILTGDPDVDEVSKIGLEGLSEILRARTSVEPADPAAVDIERDELRFYPLIYWPITSVQRTPSKEASAAIDRYLKTGGILFLDTRDQHITLGRNIAGNADLRRLLSGIEIPPLAQAPQEHVLSKAFYLMNDYPGRWAGGRLWIESGGGRVNDGVATIIISGNDHAGAWAIDPRGRGLLPVAPGGETQREMAFRFGVNLVMYALTGNYKDDMVHMPDIMQRLRR